MAAAAPHRKLAADDRRRTLLTPEGLALNLTLAARGARAGALMLDLIMVSAAMVFTTIALFLMAGGLFGIDFDSLDEKSAIGRAFEFLAVLWIVAMFLFRNAWFLFFELGPRGATPGKRIVGIRVASRDGGQLTTEAVIARNIIRDIELFLPLVFIASASDGGDMGLAGWAGLAWFLVFALFPFFNRDRLRCGDVVAGTWVVEAPKRKLEQAMSGGAHAAARNAVDAPAYVFGPNELGVYGEYELQVLEQVLRDGRPDAMTEVARTICGKIGWNPPGEGGERAFLEAYYTQLRARLERGMRFGKRKADKFAGEA